MVVAKNLLWQLVGLVIDRGLLDTYESLEVPKGDSFIITNLDYLGVADFDRPHLILE